MPKLYFRTAAEPRGSCKSRSSLVSRRCGGTTEHYVTDLPAAAGLADPVLDGRLNPSAGSQDPPACLLCMDRDDLTHGRGSPAAGPEFMTPVFAPSRSLTQSRKPPRQNTGLSNRPWTVR